jgi:hypothetical protein
MFSPKAWEFSDLNYDAGKNTRGTIKELRSRAKEAQSGEQQQFSNVMVKRAKPKR